MRMNSLKKCWKTLLAIIDNKIEAKITAIAEVVENADGDVIKALCHELQ